MALQDAVEGKRLAFLRGQDLSKKAREVRFERVVVK
jgi:hypothetical protein